MGSSEQQSSQTFDSSISPPVKTVEPPDRVSIGWPPISLGPSMVATRMELALAISGVALVVFMALHMGLLLSSMVGVETMNRLASFLERNYLLQSVAPLLVLLILAHVILASRKIPSSTQQQLAMVKHMRTLWHVDTWAWGLQIITGLALLVLVSIHLWIILTDLPIQALKSGARVHGVYLWFYIPFVVLTEMHASAGLYRIAVKWGLMERRWAHITITLWTALFLALGFTILLTFYWIGAQS